MAELCMICKKKMYIGEAYRVSTAYEDVLIGFVHRTCLDDKIPKVSKEVIF